MERPVHICSPRQRSKASGRGVGAHAGRREASNAGKASEMEIAPRWHTCAIMLGKKE